LSILINVEQEDIDSGSKPIENAVKRQYGWDSVADKRFLVYFRDGQYVTKRLPVSAEKFMKKLYFGEQVEPFSFEV
jgi:hypothetical protein